MGYFVAELTKSSTVTPDRSLTQCFFGQKELRRSSAPYAANASEPWFSRQMPHTLRTNYTCGSQ